MSNLIHFKRNPFGLLQEEWNKLTHFFDQEHPHSLSSNRNFEENNLFPSIDLVEDKETLKIEAEMPGMGEEDIRISVVNNILVIVGEKSTSKQDKDKHYLSREICYGRYERRIALPNYIEANQAKASFKKGMLWVVFPKKPHAIQEASEIKIEKA